MPALPLPIPVHMGRCFLGCIFRNVTSHRISRRDLAGLGPSRAAQLWVCISTTGCPSSRTQGLPVSAQSSLENWQLWPRPGTSVERSCGRSPGAWPLPGLLHAGGEHLLPRPLQCNYGP